MRRFAQKTEDKISKAEPSWEAEKISEEKKKIEKFLESEKDIIAFCNDLRSAGNGLKQVASKVPQPYFLVSAALSLLGDKFIKVGNDAVNLINARKTAILAFETSANLTPLYQPTSKTPGLKRYIPFVGDIINFKYTQTLSYQKDLIELRSKYGVLAFKPGLTGLAQISSYDGMNIIIKVDFDKEYINSVSLKTDILIILKTFIYLLKSPPVY